jgi:hypothetical protein
VGCPIASVDCACAHRTGTHCCCTMAGASARCPGVTLSTYVTAELRCYLHGIGREGALQRSSSSEAMLALPPSYHQVATPLDRVMTLSSQPASCNAEILSASCFTESPSGAQLKASSLLLRPSPSVLPALHDEIVLRHERHVCACATALRIQSACST